MDVYDVGGERSERKKWAQFFDDTSGIIFVISLGSYDQVIVEDNLTNRGIYIYLFCLCFSCSLIFIEFRNLVREAMNLYSTICNCPVFKTLPMIIFLNKADVFEEKFKNVPLKTFFPEYNGEFVKDKHPSYYFCFLKTQNRC
jgi:hypothetical protein